MGIWDQLTKMLIRAHPQDLVSLLLQDALYLETIDKELKVGEVEADFLCKVHRKGEEIILHVEFQKKKDEQMGRRTWKYNCITTFLENLPVYSFVIYLTELKLVDEPPFTFSLKDGQVIHIFQYTNVFLWETPPEVLLRQGLEGMLPLLPLTKGAEHARDTIVDDMINALRRAGKDDVLALGYAFASLIYDKEGDKQWLRRRFAMFEEALEDSWFVKEIAEKGLQKGLQKGLEQGLEQGRQQGEVQALRPILIRVVETRFPELFSLAQQEAERLTTPAALNAKIDQLLLARTLEEVRQALQGS